MPVFALVDCNNFFVSCERVFRPDLWNKPVVVLSNNDGCIVARSNEVKALGIPMGVPLFKVRDIVQRNQVQLFSGNFRLYGDFSQRVVSILQQESPDIEIYSVDESFLEISTLPIADYDQWARELSAKIFQWTGIPVSIGVAPNKTLAKAAADYAKKHPECRGGYAITAHRNQTPDEAEKKRQDLLELLTIGEIWGVGWRMAPKLRAIGMRTAADLAKVSDAWALKNMTVRGLKLVHELKGESCYGLEIGDDPQQSIARTRSFGHSIRDYFELEGAIATFAAQAALKLRSEGELAGAVLTFLRTSKHSQVIAGGSHLTRLLPPTSDTGEIIAAALEGLRAIQDPEVGYGKGGVVLLDLRPKTAWQLELGGDVAQVEHQARLMEAVDMLNHRYKTRLVRHASEHLERTQWFSKRQRRSPAYTTNWHEIPTITL